MRGASGSRSARGAFAICAFAVALALSACSDSSTGTGPPPPLVDGRIVAFVSDSGNHDGSNIFLMHADGSHTDRVTSGEFHDDVPAWSPDGSTMAFQTDRAPAGIWVVEADGSNLRPLIADRPDFVGPAHPAWSPDGHSIAFDAAANDSAADYPGVIMIADADGTNARRVAKFTEGLAWPSWSPDGGTITFDADTNGMGPFIFSVKTDGTLLRRLTTSDLAIQPKWSPDGRQIAYAGVNFDDPAGLHRIWIMQKDGSSPRVLTASGTHRAPSWSPDGRQLAYEGFDRDSTGVPSTATRIFRINADGSRLRPMTSDGAQLQPFFRNWGPAWKPAP
jgi:Tol biopolymer transport system component